MSLPISRQIFGNLITYLGGSITDYFLFGEKPQRMKNKVIDISCQFEGTVAVPDATETNKGAVEFAANGESAANLAVQSNDARLSNSRAPTAHNHVKADVTDFAHTHVKADITNFSHTHLEADITDLKAYILTTDPRLSDSRTPTAHTHLAGDLPATVIYNSDSRLSDARTPLAHNHVKANITDFSHNHVKADVTDFEHSHVKADVTDLVDATTAVKGLVELATDGESAANVAVQGNDARLSNARTPTAHTHEFTDLLQSKVTTGLSISNVSTEQDVFLFTVPANTLGINNVVKFTVYGHGLQNNGTQTYRFRIYFGGTEIWQDLSISMLADPVERVFRFEFQLCGNGTTSSQKCYGLGISSIGSANVGLGNIGTDEIDFVGGIISNDPAKDSTVDQVFKITCTMSSASVNHNITIEKVIIEKLAGN